MLQKSIYLLLLLFLFSACDDATYQYNVYVKNATDQPIKVAFKSQVTIDGPVEKTIIIPTDKIEKIMSSIDIDPEETSWGTSAAHCKYVADYVTAYLLDDTPAKIEWCDKKNTL